MRKVADHLIEDSELNALAVTKGFREPSLNAIGEAERLQSTLGEVRLQFPFPPKSCQDAALTIERLKTAIKDTQGQIAAGSTNRVGARYVTAYQQILGEFNQWALKNQCQVQQQQTEDKEFLTNVLSALDSGTGMEQSNKSTDNWLIYGIIGLIVIGTGIIIIAKSKRK